jgi:uncharacterized protein (DUF849 family)
LAEIPDEWIVAIAGIGRSQLTANTLALLYADGLRIGLEDNLWFDRERSVLAQNAQLVERVLRLANEMERPVAAREEVRQRLNLAN